MKPPLDTEALGAVDNERARLRKVLHDSVCQSLNALQIFVHLHARRLASAQNPIAGDAERLQAEFQQSMAELRDVVAFLGPPLFEPIELADELTLLGQRVSRRLPCSLVCDPAVILSSAHAHAVYEICRESLLLFVGIELVQQIELAVAATPHEVILNLRARTVAVPELPSVDSWAHRVLAARIAAVGGQLTLTPCVGDGLFLSCSLPFASV